MNLSQNVEMKKRLESLLKPFLLLNKYISLGRYMCLICYSFRVKFMLHFDKPLTNDKILSKN